MIKCFLLVGSEKQSTFKATKRQLKIMRTFVIGFEITPQSYGALISCTKETSFVVPNQQQTKLIFSVILRFPVVLYYSVIWVVRTVPFNACEHIYS